MAHLAKASVNRTLQPMITVATCSNPAEAMLLKSLLEANDITAYVPEELTAQSAPHFSGSGIRVQVDDEHGDAAKRILEEAEANPDDENATGEADDKDED
jgi:hypothetical protein